MQKPAELTLPTTKPAEAELVTETIKLFGCPRCHAHFAPVIGGNLRLFLPGGSFTIKAGRLIELICQCGKEFCWHPTLSKEERARRKREKDARKRRAAIAASSAVRKQ